MITLATELLIGVKLDWAVAVAENKQQGCERIIKICRKEETTPQWVERETRENSFLFTEFSPSRSETGNAIIKRESIVVEYLPNSEIWKALSPIKDGGHIRYSHSGPTALIAAMRCYVATQLGSSIQLAPCL